MNSPDLEQFTSAGGANVTFTPGLGPYGAMECDGCDNCFRATRDGARQHAKKCRTPA